MRGFVTLSLCGRNRIEAPNAAHLAQMWACLLDLSDHSIKDKETASIPDKQRLTT